MDIVPQTQWRWKTFSKDVPIWNRKGYCSHFSDFLSYMMAKDWRLCHSEERSDDKWGKKSLISVTELTQRENLIKSCLCINWKSIFCRWPAFCHRPQGDLIAKRLRCWSPCDQQPGRAHRQGTQRDCPCVLPRFRYKQFTVYSYVNGIIVKCI